MDTFSAGTVSSKGEAARMTDQEVGIGARELQAAAQYALGQNPFVLSHALTASATEQTLRSALPPDDKDNLARRRAEGTGAGSSGRSHDSASRRRGKNGSLDNANVTKTFQTYRTDRGITNELRHNNAELTKKLESLEHALRQSSRREKSMARENATYMAELKGLQLAYREKVKEVDELRDQLRQLERPHRMGALPPYLSAKRTSEPTAAVALATAAAAAAAAASTSTSMTTLTEEQHPLYGEPPVDAADKLVRRERARAPPAGYYAGRLVGRWLLPVLCFWLCLWRYTD
ncbi:hypothetical protein NFJ02_03g100900 [Pycnococcus provasolii]